LPLEVIYLVIAVLYGELGRTDEARAEFERAASLTQNARERELLIGRARACHAE